MRTRCVRRRSSSGWSRRTPADGGAALVLAVVLVVVLGLVAAALVAYAGTAFRQTVVTQQKIDKVAAANAGIRYALDELQYPPYCSLPSADSPEGQVTLLADLANGRDVRVTCRRLGGEALTPNGWAVVVTGLGVGTENAFLSQSASSTLKKIEGPVFLQDWTRSDIKVPVQIVDGDVWYSATDCDTAPAPDIPGISFGARLNPQPGGYQCIEASWSDVAQVPVLPSPAPVGPVDPPGIDDANGCRVFEPGVYTEPPQLGSFNYFRSGLYRFLNMGEWSVKQARVYGGRPNTNRGDPATPITATPGNPCNDVWNFVEPSGAAGVTWVFEGNSRLSIDSQGVVELFRSDQGDYAVSIVALENNQGDYSRSTAGLQLLNIKSGNPVELVVRGQLWAPADRIIVENNTNIAKGQFLGGVVAGQFEVGASASTTGLVISVQTTPSVRDLVIESTALGEGTRDVKATAVVELVPPSTENDPFQLVVNSWRVN